MKRLNATPRHQTSGNRIALLLVSGGVQDAFALQVIFSLRQTTGTHDCPIKTTLFQGLLTNTLPHQDQTEQVEGVLPTPRTQGAHQHHAANPDPTTTVHLALHPPGIHTHRPSEVHGWSRASGDHQRINTLECGVECMGIHQGQTALIRSGKGAGQLRLGPQQQTSLIPTGLHLFGNAVTGLAGGAADRNGVGHGRWRGMRR